MPVLSQIKPVHNFQFCLKSILILLSPLRLVLHSGLFPSCLLTISIEIQDMYVYFICGTNCIKCTQPISETEGCFLLGSNVESFVEVTAVSINLLHQSSYRMSLCPIFYLAAQEVHVLMTSRIGCGENKIP